MIRILLVCNAGMSTSMLVKKMQDYALKTDIEAKIWAVGDAASVKEVEKADIVCLGPQVRYLEKKMNERVKHEKPVMVIDFTAYGSMNGEKVLKEMEGLELICFQIISNVGMARSCYIEAVEHAKEADFEAYEASMNEGDCFFEQAHQAHSSLIQKEADGQPTQITLLLMHAEDQLMSAEGFKILAAQFADVYRRL